MNNPRGEFLPKKSQIPQCDFGWEERVTVPLATGYDPFYIHGYVDIIHSFGYFLDTKWIISGYYPDIFWIYGYRLDIVGFQNIHGYDPKNIHSVS